MTFQDLIKSLISTDRESVGINRSVYYLCVDFK